MYPAICSILFFLFSAHLSAQWSTNPAVNNAICTAIGSQTNPTIVNDGSGGAIITWSGGGGAYPEVYAQRINATGTVQWTAGGVVICSHATIGYRTATIVSDGTGGAIISWIDSRNGLSNQDIYAQKINSSGVVQWLANGVVITTAPSAQGNSTMVSDGSGGAIITWTDYRGGNSDIYAQRINATGTVQWTANGISVSTATGNQLNPTIVSDGTGGAIITWQDTRNAATTGADIYAQKINALGAVQWTADGVALCVTTGEQLYPAIVSDGTNGAIITWQDLRSGAVNSIFAQWIDSFGHMVWTANGVAISTLTGLQSVPKIVSDGFGGAIITWEDNGSGPTLDIKAQKINGSGIVQWTANGIGISNTIGDQTNPQIVSDGLGGAIISWHDTRNGISNRDIYVQKINSSGAVQWKLDGIAICTALNNQSFPTIISDGSGGAIITWQDNRSGIYSNIYTQKIDKYGFLGQAEPKLITAKDIANDQGGRLRLFWDPSYLDAEAYQKVKSYTILLGAKTTGILGKNSGAQGSGIYWQKAGSIPAEWFEGYSAVIPTYADSGLQGVPMYYFQVIAKNSDSTQMWYSNIDSGYSVDNIPPVGVGNAIIASNGGLVFMKWNKDRVDKDLMEYRIYRSTTPGFAIGTATKLRATNDTTYTDSTGASGTTYYYRIAAVDVHGNIGTPSAELNQKVLTVQGIRGIAPKEFTLEQNYPKPFNPTTNIVFTVPSNGRALLTIFNTLGQEVATLFNGEVEPGKYYNVQFNASSLASGLYFSRLEFDGKVQLKKMQLVK